ncbi:hypothetical protein ACFFMN_06450 [Planobispora siamensis]|uniref:Uncharacterized protein n=1 Tax=Planobispora siamensis TaxID=936338 RepID=A0A8J3SGA3_9ACTN|nr:hypothetical protein [Planobispora siamensis]GIH92789.1 hypothetical protein Psi01_34190 [Planobispora siamensis]
MTPEAETPFERLMRRREAISETRAKAEMLIVILEARGIALQPAQREKVDSCTDPVLLTIWATRAMTASDPAEIFEDR